MEGRYNSGGGYLGTAFRYTCVFFSCSLYSDMLSIGSYTHAIAEHTSDLAGWVYM